MISLLIKIIRANYFYHFGRGGSLPLNLVISVTNQCNSRCLTCNIWQTPPSANELNLSELKKIFKNIGFGLEELILTGGEPFLRKDLGKICKLACKYLKPKAIIIPTNCLLGKTIIDQTKKILRYCPKTTLILNLSLDGIGAKHDKIRGVKGNFIKFKQVYFGLKKIRSKNLQIKVHSVISVFNNDDIVKIFHFIKFDLGLVDYITEIAEQRVELNNTGKKITPGTKEYFRAIDFLSAKIKEEKYSGWNRITQIFRLEYYRLVKKMLQEKKAIIPCLAGIASAQIAADGEIWACCIRAESMGNLRKNNYNFRKIWFSRKATKVRQQIKLRKCYCPLANAAYTNMLCYPPLAFKAGFSLLIDSLKIWK